MNILLSKMRSFHLSVSTKFNLVDTYCIINSVEFEKDLNFNVEISKQHNPETLAMFYYTELRNIFDKHAHEIEQVKTTGPTLPWFTNESNQLKV
jgi:hypothetical protein